MISGDRGMNSFAMTINSPGKLANLRARTIHPVLKSSTLLNELQEHRNDLEKKKGFVAFVEDNATLSSILKILYHILCKTKESRPY